VSSKDALAELTAELVAIESVNPDLVPGGAGEAKVAELVAAWLDKAGLEVEVTRPAPGRPNVVARARGSGGGRALLLNAHMDTVGIAGVERPFEPVVREGRLHGRGAGDMKGSLAAIMLVGAEAVGMGLRGDVVVTAVSDEEVGSIGMEALVASVTADAAIVTEPTDERVAVAHRGFVGFEVVAHGRAAHGSRPDLGVDAIAAMGPVLARITELGGRLSDGESHPLLGTGSVHASLIEGGQEYSSYPARCLLTGERRTIPGESIEQIRAELEELITGVDADVSVLFWRRPFEVSASEDVVQALMAATGATEVGGVAYWADSALLADAGIPTVVFGPVTGDIHGEDEWVDLASLERCRAAYANVARRICS
jgi:acetylornithine deacetylase